MLACPRPARDLLANKSERLACVRGRVVFSKVHHASKSEDLFACIDLT